MNYTPWKWPSKGFNMLHLRKEWNKSIDLVIYKCISRCLFDIVILEQEYEQDRVA
jgi:hypothetical protein